jgi:transposase-like protein
LILENLKVKPRKHDLERISMAIAAYLLGVPITKLGIPPSTIYYYTRKLGVRKGRGRLGQTVHLVSRTR